MDIVRNQDAAHRIVGAVNSFLWSPGKFICRQRKSQTQASPEFAHQDSPRQYRTANRTVANLKKMRRVQLDVLAGENATPKCNPPGASIPLPGKDFSGSLLKMQQQIQQWRDHVATVIGKLYCPRVDARRYAPDRGSLRMSSGRLELTGCDAAWQDVGRLGGPKQA